jgi:hypothetical protein
VDGTEQRRTQLEEWRASGFREADKLIVTVASGVLAFSAAFVRGISKMKGHEAIGVAWVMLVLAITLVLMALFMEQRDLGARIKNINKGRHEGGYTWRNGAIATLNILSSVTFLVGMVAVVSFLIANVN